MIPDAYAIEVLKKRACSADLDAWLQGQTRAISSSETGWQGADPGIMTMLVDVCQSQLQRIRSWLKGPGRPNTIYPCTKECLQQSEFLETVVKTIICLHNPVLLRDAITVCPRRISLPLWEDIGRSVDPNHLREYCLG